jgi:BirA family transcriptional regulator, biotin operon repressor / biotin---[acetyl-CoA-carboxylase] ligase
MTGRLATSPATSFPQPSAAPILPPEFRLLDYDRLGSSNDEAKTLARGGATHGTVVWARRQDAGHGRRGRAWISPEGSLAASFILRPDCMPFAAAQLGFVAALGLGDALAPHVPALRYKWPNDVLVDGSKISGILLESETGPAGTLSWIVVGIGVNIVDHPRDTEIPATSLCAVGCRDIDAATLLGLLASSLLRWYETWLRDGFAPVRAAWLARAAGLGEAIAVRLPHETIGGRFAGLDEGGALILESDAGSRRISAGEIFPVGG